MVLAARTEVALFEAPHVTGDKVGDITPVARDGHVVLRGAVDSEDARRAASDVASRVPGVSRVDNELQVLPATAAEARADEHIARDARKVMKRTRGLARLPIRVRVEGGIVELSGSVPDVSDWALASRTARNVVSARGVQNNLTIVRPRLGA
jgi:osmotically-inducible protein OsmY